MRRLGSRLASVAFALLMILGACRTPAPTFTPTPPDLPALPSATPTSPGSITPTQAIPTRTPTQAPPSPTPLPTWPDRWQPTGGPFGGPIEALAIDPVDHNTLYAAGTGGAIYKSIDGGETWSPGERLAPSNCSFSSLVIDIRDSSIVYTANPCIGVFKSPDGGTTWRHVGDGIDARIALLAQSPHAPELLLAADYDGQVYRSFDGAMTWEPISNGLPGELIRGLDVSDSETYWATTANGDNGTLYRFRGGVWSAVPFGQPPETDTTNILVDPDNPAIVYVGLEHFEGTDPGPVSVYLFRSTDGGSNWSALPSVTAPSEADKQGAEIKARAYILGKGRISGTLYIADAEGLMSSLDGGETWRRTAPPGDALLADGIGQIAIDPIDNDVLYIPLRTGVAKSKDGGQTWRAINQGLNSVVVGLIAPHPTDPATLLVAPIWGLSTFKSTDYGDSWLKLVNDSLDHQDAQRVVALTFDPVHRDTVYQVVDVARAYRSKDGGATWSTAWPEFRSSSIYGLVTSASAPNIIYVNKNGFGLFRSDDHGESWHFLSQSEVDSTYALSVHPDRADLILSGESHTPFESGARLRRSRDGGEIWEVVLEIPEAVGITSVAFDPRVEPYFAPGKRPADPTRLYASSVGPQGILWFSNDAGDSWKTLNRGLNFAHVNTIAVPPHRPDVAYAGLRDAGTWRTEDGGQSWHRVPGDPATSVAALVIDPSNHNIIYVADGTTPHLYRSTDAGNNWELLFDAGTAYDRLEALAVAPSDPRILYTSALKTGNSSVTGSLFRIDISAPAEENANDISDNLPGPVTSLAIDRYDAFRVFATVQGVGLWKTVDGGVSWRRVKSDLPEASFYQIAIDPALPDTLFLAGGYDVHQDASTEPAHSTGEHVDLNPNEIHGIWKSIDEGNTWIKVGGAPFSEISGPIRAIAFHPDDQRVMYAAGEGGIYLSPDRGETWTIINGRLPFVPMNAVATDGQVLYAGSAGGGVFRGAVHPLIYTADWLPESHLVIPIYHIQVTLHPENPQILYATAYPGGVFKSSDGGATWGGRSFGLPSFAVADPLRQGRYLLAVAPSAPEVLYCGITSQGIHRSDDGAVSWRPVYGEGEELRGADVQALLVHPEDPDTVYIGTSDGVWRTINGGRSWDPYSTGLPPSGAVGALALGSDGQLYAGVLGYGLFSRDAFPEASDNGWRQLPELGNWGLPWPLWDNQPLYQSTSLLFQPGGATVLYAGTFPSGIYKTIDGGVTWHERNVGLKNEGVLSLAAHPDDEQIVYAGTADGLARSVDGGATWHPWDTGWPSHQWVLDIAIDPTEPNTLYACSKNSLALGEEQEGSQGTVMKSTDAGATWFEITTGLDTDQAFVKLLIDRFDADILYLATEREGVYISRDGGATWSSWNEGLWNRIAGGDSTMVTDVLGLSADGRLLYFGTAGSGVWRRPAAGAP